MKRKLQFFLLMAFAIIGFTSCNDDDVGIGSLETPKIARFADGDREITISENSSEILEIPVYINYVNERPITVSYEIEGDTHAVSDLSTVIGSVEIPAGEKTGSILLKPIDNDDFNTPYNQVIVRILGGEEGYGLPDDMTIGHEEKKIIFEDDDCMPLEDRNDFVGALFCEDVGYGTVDGVMGMLSEVKGECSVLIVQGNLPNSQAALSPDFKFYFTQEAPGMGTVTCPKQPYGGNFYEAEGVYEDGVMTVDYIYSKSDGSEIWTGVNVIKLK